MVEAGTNDRRDDGRLGAAALAPLRALVRRHQVCWESRPEYAAVDGNAQQVGFVVEITATYDHPARPPVAGCTECDAPLRALDDILDYVVPRERRDSIYELHLRRGAIQSDRRRWNRPEVSAAIRVVHGDGADRPVDACEDRCRREIIGKLKELGACEGVWHPIGN
jgi:hypothetical protein